MINEQYVNWLVDFIKNGTINKNTGKAFVLEDIKIEEYKIAVQAELNKK